MMFSFVCGVSWSDFGLCLLDCLFCFGVGLFCVVLFVWLVGLLFACVLVCLVVLWCVLFVMVVRSLCVAVCYDAWLLA